MKPVTSKVAAHLSDRMQGNAPCDIDAQLAAMTPREQDRGGNVIATLAFLLSAAFVGGMLIAVCFYPGMF